MSSRYSIERGPAVSVIINLDEPLSTKLDRQASARRLGLEEFAHHLPGEALQQLELAEHWRATNRRRLELIRNSTAMPLSQEEEAELQQLQEELDQRLEPADNRLLDGLEHLKQAVLQLPEGPDAA